MGKKDLAAVLAFLIVPMGGGRIRISFCRCGLEELLNESIPLGLL